MERSTPNKKTHGPKAVGLWSAVEHLVGVWRQHAGAAADGPRPWPGGDADDVAAWAGHVVESHRLDGSRRSRVTGHVVHGDADVRVRSGTRSRHPAIEAIVLEALGDGQPGA